MTAWCGLRGCEDIGELVGGIPLCPNHQGILKGAFKAEFLAETNVGPRQFREVVYYTTWPDADVVKIGTSTRLRTRMHGLSSGLKGRARLLVVEPGSFALERKRHREFKAVRKSGTELFRLVPLIQEHIDNLRRQWPNWLELSGVGDEWL